MGTSDALGTRAVRLNETTSLKKEMVSCMGCEIHSDGESRNSHIFLVARL